MRSKVYLTVVVLFMLLWSYASWSKLATYGLTTLKMQSQPLPEWSRDLLAWLVPSMELLLAALLCWPRTRQLGLLLSTHLMLVFSLFVVYVIHLPKDQIPCSCGGLIGRMGWKGHLWFNLSFYVVGIAGSLLWTQKK